MPTTYDSLVGLTAPAFAEGSWFNSVPLSLQDLSSSGQPVVIHFWTASCPVSRKVLPQIARLWQTYQHQGLVVIGIHCPEFNFERDPAVLAATLAELAISWTIIHDPTHQSVQRYTNHYWPRQLVVDPAGTIIIDQIGEGDLPALEESIQLQLLRHGAQELPPITPPSHQHKLGLTCYPASSETHLGHQRGTFKNRSRATNVPTNYVDPLLPRHPGAALHGRWTVTEDSVSHNSADSAPTNGYISVVFSGFEATLIAETSDARPLELVVTLNGRPVPLGFQGKDVKEQAGQTITRISAPGPYQLIHTRTYLSPAELRCSDQSGRLIAYAFHFSGCQED